MDVRTQYARSGELDIAYQVHGDGPLDLIFVPIFATNIEIIWEHPGIARFLNGLSSFARLITFDRRGTGMSDGTPGAATLEEQIDDVLAVLDAVGAERPGFVSLLEGAALASLFAASHPDKVQGLAMNGVEPTYDNIASFKYPGARPLFIYVKNAHLDAIRGLREFVGEWAKSWGKDGPLAAIGFVASPDDVAARSLAASTAFPALDGADLK